MGPFRAGRFQQFTFSRQRTRKYSETNETDLDTPTSGRFGYDTTRQETVDWGELDYSYGDDLDETH